MINVDYGHGHKQGGNKLRGGKKRSLPKKKELADKQNRHNGRDSRHNGQIFLTREVRQVSEFYCPFTARLLF